MTDNRRLVGGLGLALIGAVVLAVWRIDEVAGDGTVVAYRLALLIVGTVVVIQLGSDQHWLQALTTGAGALAAALLVTLSGIQIGSLSGLGLVATAAGAIIMQYSLERRSSAVAVLAVGAALGATSDVGFALLVALLAATASDVFLQVSRSPTTPATPTAPAEPTGPGVPPPTTARTGAVPYLTIGDPPQLLRTEDTDLPPTPMFAFPGHQYDGYRHRNLLVRSASHVGTMHLHRKKPRQDAVAVGASDDGRYLIAAVADGLGSQRHSAAGANWAVSLANWFVAQRLARGVAVDGPTVVSFVSDRLSILAKSLLKVEASELSTTLICLVVDTETGDAHMWRVGDSTAFSAHGGRLVRHFADDLAADSATDALPAADADAVEESVTTISQGECVMLTTDGIGKIVAASTLVADRFAAELSRPLAAYEFSALAGFQRTQATDDQTAVAVWRVTA